MPNSNSVEILKTQEIEKKLQRMAYEIHENTYAEKQVILLGIKERGCKLAEKLLPYLHEISKDKFILQEIALDKKDPTKYEFTEGFDPQLMRSKSVVLIDDVLNTGKTLMYAAAAVMFQHCSSLLTVILVNRRHRLFPVRADIVGLTLSTTLKEHIRVYLDSKKMAVYLE